MANEVLKQNIPSRTKPNTEGIGINKSSRSRKNEASTKQLHNHSTGAIILNPPNVLV